MVSLRVSSLLFRFSCSEYEFFSFFKNNLLCFDHKKNYHWDYKYHLHKNFLPFIWRKWNFSTNLFFWAALLPEIQIRIQGPIIVTLPSWNYHPMQRNGTALEQLIIWYQLEIDVNSSAILALYRLHVSLNFSFLVPSNFLDSKRIEQVCKPNGWRKPDHVDVQCKRDGKFTAWTTGFPFLKYLLVSRRS